MALLPLMMMMIIVVVAAAAAYIHTTSLIDYHLILSHLNLVHGYNCDIKYLRRYLHARLRQQHYFSLS